MDLDAAAKQAHEHANSHGFWAESEGSAALHEEVQFGRIHSEVGEAYRAWRLGDIEELTEELADIVIRVLDLAGHWNMSIEKAVADKMAYNLTRPYRHGRARG